MTAPRWAVGLMSGTSLDGIDAAAVLTDGERVLETGPALTMPYQPALRDGLRRLIEQRDATAAGVPDIERAMTLAHGAAVEALVSRMPSLEASFSEPGQTVIGFHGQTIVHRPADGLTWQIGDGALLAEMLGVTVVCDFRRRDMAAAGEGAPLAPLYHAALAGEIAPPLAVLNLGGVGNVTFIGEPKGEDDGQGRGGLIAFDTGPGCALIDDWVAGHTGRACDIDGRLALAGDVDRRALDRLMAAPYFSAPPPKSLDRNYFAGHGLEGSSLEDGAATLTAFTARAVAVGLGHLPAAPRRVLVTGGGRRNPAIMAALRDYLAVPVEPVEAVGWDGDALEAQAFAFLAVRALRRLPLTLPGTTGVSRAVTGGAIHLPSQI